MTTTHTQKDHNIAYLELFANGAFPIPAAKSKYVIIP